MKRKYRPWARSLSGLYQNISASWLGLAFITPNFASLNSQQAAFVLTLDILFGILFLLLSVKIEQMLNS